MKLKSRDIRAMCMPENFHATVSKIGFAAMLGTDNDIIIDLGRL